MQRVAWIIGLLAASSPALGSELFRCIDPAGAVTWQDRPCGAGSRLTKTIAVAEADRQADGASAGSSKATVAKPKASKSTGRTTAGSTGGAKRDSRARQRERCKAARAERDRKLEALGLSRTFEQLRALDDNVRAVCKDL
jgi:hypothetical protein